MGNASDPFMVKINPPASPFAQRVHSSTKKKRKPFVKGSCMRSQKGNIVFLKSSVLGNGLFHGGGRAKPKPDPAAEVHLESQRE
jgi:hypothetical protein